MKYSPKTINYGGAFFNRIKNKCKQKPTAHFSIAGRLSPKNWGSSIYYVLSIHMTHSEV